MAGGSFMETPLTGMQPDTPLRTPQEPTGPPPAYANPTQGTLEMTYANLGIYLPVNGPAL